VWAEPYTLAEIWTTRDLACARQQLWRENQVRFHRFEVQDQRIWHWRTPILMHCLSILATDWISFLREKNVISVTFYSLLHQTPFSNFFSVVYVNSILSLKQMVNQQQFWAAISEIKVCFIQFFSRVLFEHFKPRSPWTKWFEWHQLLLFAVLNDRLVAGLRGLVPVHLPW